MAKQTTTVTIRAMEPEDIDGILEVDRKIMGEHGGTASHHHKGLVRGALGGEIAMSFMAEDDGEYSRIFRPCRGSALGAGTHTLSLRQMRGPPRASPFF